MLVVLLSRFKDPFCKIYPMRILFKIEKELYYESGLDILQQHTTQHTSLVAGEQYTNGEPNDSRPRRWSLCT